MTRTLLIAVLILTLPVPGFAKDPPKHSPDTAKWFTAIPDGSGTTRFYGKDGSSSGRAEANQKTTRFYGKDGSSDGRAEQSGNTTRFFSKDGSSVGRAEISGNTTRFYNKDGSLAGRSERSGNTTRFYGKDGSSLARIIQEFREFMGLLEHLSC